MSDDIVERLRELASTYDEPDECDYGKAAAEIEKLRAEIAEWKAAFVELHRP